MFYSMNSGVAYIYEILDTKSDGGKPLKPIGQDSRMFFDFISISAADYNHASQDDVKIESRIRVLQDKKISSQNIIKINDIYYKVWRVKHSINKFGVPITDITLETTFEDYEVIEL